MPQQTQSASDSINSITSELGIRLSELEEKQRLLKDRILLVGNNLISIKEAHDRQFYEIKKQLKEIESDIKSIKQLNERILSELGNFARKSELEILKRQFTMFEPLEFARMSDIREIVKEELSKINKEKVNKNN